MSRPASTINQFTDRTELSNGPSLQERSEIALERYSAVVRTVLPGDYIFGIDESFKVNLETREISFGYSFMEWAETHPELGEKGVLWALCHEAEHVADLLGNPVGMFANFEKTEIYSRRFSLRAQSVLTKRGVEIDPQLLNEFVYANLSRFWDYLDDMYVNQRIGLVAKSLDSSSDFVQRLYRDFLFPTVTWGQAPSSGEVYDITYLPKSLQLGTALLRGLMVPNQEILVSTEVQEVLDSIHQRLSDTRYNLSFKERVLQGVAPRNTDCEKRFASLHFAQAAFLELLLDDLATMDITVELVQDMVDRNQQPQDNTGNDQGVAVSDNNPWVDVRAVEMPDPIDKDDVTSVCEQAANTPLVQAVPAVLSPDEAMRASFLGDLSDSALTHNLTEADAMEYLRLKERVGPYIASLAEEFQKLLANTRLIAHSDFYLAPRGGKLDVAAFIRAHAPMLVSNSPDTSLGTTPVYRRISQEEKLTVVPDNVTFSLILDNSGSMISTRLEVLKELSVLIMEAMYIFETKVNNQLPPESKEFVCETDVQLFGSVPVIAKAAGGGIKDIQSEYAARMLAVRRISNWLGGTADASALRGIVKSIKESTDTVNALREGSSLHFVFEITDGGTFTAEETRDSLTELRKLGVSTHGFQVGDTTPQEDAIFSFVWGSSGTKITDIQQLVPVVGRIFFESVRDRLHMYSLDTMEGND